MLRLGVDDGELTAQELTAPGPRRTILVLGSSVAAGAAASVGRGWASLLEAALLSQYGPGYRLLHGAVGGFDTGACQLYAESIAIAPSPDAVIIALGLANEGLPFSSDQRGADAVAERFLAGLRGVGDAVRERWGPVALVYGGVYPFGRAEGGPRLDGSQRRALERVAETMARWDEPVLPFLDAAGEGESRCWRAHTAADVGHPNDDGHRHMFEAIDLRLFSPEAVPPLERGFVARARAPRTARSLWAFYALDHRPP